MHIPLTDKVYASIRERLVVGDFPPGTRLDYKKISFEQGVSTTPVREAMVRLASDGLIELVPRAGAIVKVLLRDEVEQLYGCREAFEVYTIRLAAQHITPRCLQEVEQLIAQMRGLIAEHQMSGHAFLTGDKLTALLEADMRFHLTVLNSCRNDRIIKLAGNIIAHSWLFRRNRQDLDEDLLREADAAHTAIYEGLCRRDGEAAAQAMGRHIHRSFQLVLRDLDGRAR